MEATNDTKPVDFNEEINLLLNKIDFVSEKGK